MSSDLSRSLIDAAAEAMAALNPMLIAGQPENYVDDARAAVAAVLETLADAFRSYIDTDGERSHPMLGEVKLRRLAAEVKEDTA